MVYIGQSQNIHRRYREHISSLKRGAHCNPKVQQEYLDKGDPTLVILEICGVDELYQKEIAWAIEFNALQEGLNVLEPGVSGWGINSSQSKYSKIQVLKVFSLLTTTSMANIDISKRVKVSLKLVECIRGGYSHLWLKDTYPEKYSKLQNKSKVKNTVARRSGKLLRLVHIETSQVEVVDSVVDFTKKICGIHIESFCSGIRRVIRKEQTEYKGWKLLPAE
jgi:hypothetical protein